MDFTAVLGYFAQQQVDYTTFWTFNTPAAGVKQNNVIITTNQSTTMTLDWGDNTPVAVIASAQAATHTY